MSKAGVETIRRLVLLMVVVVVILSLIGVSQGSISVVVGWFASAIIGAGFSLVAASLIEAVTGDVLKGILIPINVFGLKFSVSLFTVATLIVKFAIFR